MRSLKVFALLAVCLFVAAPAFAADKATKKAQKKAKKVHITGVVTEVKKDEGKDTGSFTVKVQFTGKKTPGSGEQTFKVNDATTFEKVAGKIKKGVMNGSPARWSDLARDAHVTVVGKGDTATEVRIVVAKKAKKAKKKNTN
jgi:hypothetical protein